MIRLELMNLFLTKEALYRLSYMGCERQLLQQEIVPKTNKYKIQKRKRLERETRLELATFSLEG